MSGSGGREELNDVAIVGMHCRFPGADGVEAFWRNLREGVESITFLPGKPSPAKSGAEHVRAVPLLDGMELFDAGFFGFNPREAETMDPQLRVFLECAWTALETAGCDPVQTDGRIGVFAGCAFSTYLTAHLLPNTELMRAAAGGLSSLGQFNDRDSLATIVAYKLDLTGPAVTVQTFCSTSLVAVHLACQSLLGGESDVALAGGSSINVESVNGYLYQKGGILSSDGHCRSFDEEASGTVFGNGVGVVVLKRLAEAIQDGDRIHAVIRGTAVNNDGSQKGGYTAPSVVGQSKAIAEAMAVAQVDPEAIGYVEAHGTATALGDPIEVEALTRAFRASTEKRQFCALGSVKSNFGHLDRAAGVAALIKTALALERRQIPASLHFRRANPKIDFENSPFYVNTELAEWRAGKGPRLAGVSSLGVGGTNAHAILEEAPARPASGPSRSPQLLVLSARSEAALEAATRQLVRHLGSRPESELADVAFTLMTGRHRFEHRRFTVAGSMAEAAEALGSLDARRVVSGFSSSTAKAVAFMFPGQGAQHAGMGRGLYETEASFRADVDECCEKLLPALAVDLRGLLLADASSEPAGDELRQTALAQPALFVVEYALARLWIRLGVLPKAMIGHSIGEYTAAQLAGVLSLDDALALVAERGRLMQSLPPGSMLAVPLPEKELSALIAEPLALAAVNSPGLCVVSGPTPQVEALEGELGDRGVHATRLRTSHAFHSGMMDAILEPFAERVAEVELRPPAIPFVSNLTGTWITAEQATSPEYWSRHLRHAVRFSDGVDTLGSEPELVLLEVGPGSALSTFARRRAAGSDARPVVTSMRHPREGRDDRAALLAAAGRLWVAGASIEGRALFEGERRHRVALPTYPFQRERYWVDPPAAERAVRRAAAAKREPSEWFYVPVWKTGLALEAAAGESGDCAGDWLLFSGAHGLGRRLAARLRERGATSVVTVEPGERFGGDSKEGFTIDPRAREDYERVLRTLTEEGRQVSRIVHGFAVDGGPGQTSPEARWELGYYSLFSLAQALAAQRWRRPLRLKLLTSGAQAVLSDEAAAAEKAPMLALAKVVPQEQHGVTCASIDVEPADARIWRDRAALDAVLDELAADLPGAVVAYRGAQRWTRGFDPLRIPAPEGAAGLRERGVYLITGGLGGVTFVLAAYLARRVQARLVLTGRTGLPPREDWDAWLASRGEGDGTSQKLLRVRKLEELGAEVLPMSADVGDLAQMRSAIETAEARFGGLHGVIHGAGIVGGDTFRPVEQLSRIECEQQFYPKVRGLHVLDEVLRGRELDFCLLTSSLSSVLGGYGYAAYAAANLYMDAYARSRWAAGASRWISVNWDEWRLAEDGDGARAAVGGLAQFAMSPAEGAAAFARLLSRPGLEQVVVSTGSLQARLDQWIKLEGLRERPRSEKRAAAPRHARPPLQSAYIAASTPVEQKLSAIWQELLGIEKVGIHDNFFELGGHSLLAIQLVAAIKSELDAEVSVATLFEGPTVQSLSRLIGNGAEPTPAAGYEHSSARGARRKEQQRRRQAQREQSVQ